MPAESARLAKLLRAADGALGLVDLVSACTAGLPTTNELAGRGMPAEAKRGRGELERLAEEGYGQLPGVETPERCAPIAQAIDRVLSAGLPAVFVYVADLLWALGERIRAEVSALLGRDYRLLADVWAWRIDRGQRGWPPHRGSASVVLDRHAPELLNVWVAISDVDADRSCIHVIPLPEDSGYPGHLERTTAPLESVRALPVAAGSALFWNANTLHWGGACASRARGSRYSCSFSLVREDAVDLLGSPTVRVDRLDPRARVDLVASQIVTYGEGKPDVAAEVLEWARATCALNALAAHRS